MGNGQNTLFLLCHMFLFPLLSRSHDTQPLSFGDSHPSILPESGGPSPSSHSKAGQKASRYHQPCPRHTARQRQGEPSSFSLLEADGPERREGREKGAHREDFLPSQRRGLQGKPGLYSKLRFHLYSICKVLQHWLSHLLTTVHHLCTRR